ncbi:hypothetical protein PC9H_006209 [Pleurotus ostreatus]|uniref:Xylanolytic transcriptional activator regulatory domain-containing protein n=1 Tax=Pleurotus ostreatus TaxID=5322 RepID=A0A8H7DSN6_PLEOS|nr:uncharacterized protein PC9H_006209 [Pleurotus ostreatus]KAF7430501.1 hypothetical protein PC9H_006209 [Pleurotus ostreatus]
MAHANRLTEQVKILTKRVHELEGALASRGQCRPEDHSGVDNVSAEDWTQEIQGVSDTIGTLSIGVNGQIKYHGESAGSEYLHELLPVDRYRAPMQSHLPVEILELVNSFPFGMRDCPHDKYTLLPYLPSRDRALELSDLYYKHVAWMYDPVINAEFMARIIEPIYGSTEDICLDSVHSHTLSVFFVILASGVLHDPHPDKQHLSDQYLALSRAALALDPIFHEATCATVQALFMILRYNYTFDRSSTEERWLLIGLCVRIAQSIGLQRDSSGWQLDSDEVQRRRRIFWEIYMYDAWTSIVNGRPPALNLQHTDCRLPDDHEPFITESGEKQLGWHAWKLRYAVACLSTSTQHVFSANAPPYMALLDLDKKIRLQPVPPHLQSPVRESEAHRSWASDPVRAMQQYCILCERESNLLYIHRSYFAQAIRQDSDDPLKHQFAQSVLATYRSACRIISSLRGLYEVHKGDATNCWFFWSSVFSACIIFGALVIESPSCTLSRDALQEFERTLPFYEEGSATTRPPSTLSTLRKLLQRAQDTFRAGGKDINTVNPRIPELPDELEVLEGRKSVIQDRRTSSSPVSHGSSQHQDGHRHDNRTVGHGTNIPGSLHDYYHAFGNPYLRGGGGVVSEALEGRNSMMFGMSYGSDARTNAGYAATSDQRLSVTQPLAHSTHLRTAEWPHAEQGGGHMQVGPSVQQNFPNHLPLQPLGGQLPPQQAEVAYPFQSHPQQFLSPQQHAEGNHGFQIAYHERNQLDSWRNLMQQYGL